MTDEIILTQYATVERVWESKQFYSRPSLWVIEFYSMRTHFVVNADPKLNKGDSVKIVISKEAPQ